MGAYIEHISAGNNFANPGCGLLLVEVAWAVHSLQEPGTALQHVL